MRKLPAAVLPLCLLCASALFVSCVTAAPGLHRPPLEPSIFIEEKGTASAASLYSFFCAQLSRSAAGYAERTERARRLSVLYVEEGKAEGINSDAAFIQMCLETGYLGFGNLVTPEMNNFCGLGSIGPQQKGLCFPDERTGVRAHIQHLKAYGSKRPLNNPCIDPRFKYVTPRGKAPTVYELSGAWAADPSYGNKLAALLVRLSGF